VTELGYGHDLRLIVDHIDHPVVADSNPESALEGLELDATPWPGLYGEVVDDSLSLSYTGGGRARNSFIARSVVSTLYGSRSTNSSSDRTAT
jgi:hypothetical protein